MKIEDFLDRGDLPFHEVVQRGQSEGLSLDFKADHPGPEELFSSGRLTKHGRRVIGKALSAFANSAGGILVLGVDCRNVDGVDQAIGLAPIGDIEKAFSSVNSALGELLQPRHDGLRVYKTAAQQPIGSGFLVIEAPRSERRPHMSQADKHYYKRSGSSSFAMEHYDIEDAFRRQTSPVLVLSWRLEKRYSTGSLVALRLHLMVENQGNSTAKFVRLTFLGSVPGNLTITLDPGSADTLSSVPGRTIIAPPSDFVVHPRQALRLAALRLLVEKDSRGSITIDGVAWDRANFNQAYELVAENMLPQQGWMVVVKDDFRPFVVELDEADEDDDGST